MEALIGLQFVFLGYLGFRLWMQHVRVEVLMKALADTAAKTGAHAQIITDLLAWREIVRIGSKGIFENVAKEMFKKEANKYRGDA